MATNLLQTTAPSAPIDFSKVTVAPPAPAPTPTPTATITTPATKPIAASTLTAPAAPLYTPPPMTPQTAPAISGAADAALQSHTDLATQLKTDLATKQKAADTSTSDLQKTMQDILGVQKSEQSVQDSYHVDELGKLNNDAFTALQASKRAQENEVKAATDAAGGTTGGAAAAVQAINRKYAFEQADLSIALDVSNRNYLAASQTADKKIQMQLEPLQTLLQFQTTFYQKNEAALSDAEKNKLQLLIQDNTQKYQEAQTAAKTLSDTKLSTMQQAQQNGAPAAVLNAISTATTPEAALTAAGQYNVDKSKQLDVAYKQAEIAKIQSEISASGSNADPAQVLAYAQQYASDGKIPTGLPKGTFGIVAQAAKEMPKPEGTLVSNATGVAPNNLSSTQVDGIAALRDLQNKLADAKTLYDNYHHGVLAGVKNAVLPSTAEQQYQNLKGEIVDLLARARSGAALSANEEANYAAKLPGNFNNSFFFGSSGDTKLDSLSSSLTDKLNTTLATHNVSIYGYSKVDLGGQKYTVGQMVTNDQGQTGRVNPDGSITIIQ